MTYIEKENEIDLVYCIPENKKEYAIMSFRDTPA
jgi:hypothetical protein